MGKMKLAVFGHFRSGALAAALALAAAGHLPHLCAAPLELPFADTKIVVSDAIGADFAAKELNEIVKMSTGKTFAIDKTPGATKASRQIRIEIDPTMEEEESAVYAKGDSLYLVGGGTPGMLWAVYDFVEDNLGYHWYDRRPESQIVDKCDTVVFKGKATRRKPSFKGYRKDHQGHMSKLRFYLRNRENWAVEQVVKGYKWKWGNRTHGHGWDLLLPRHDKLAYGTPTNTVKNLFAAHPEWFSLDKSGKRSDRMQLCFSNLEMRDALYASLLNWVKTYGPGVYMLGVNDDHTTTPLCHCENCIALDRKHDSGGGAMWEMIVDICSRLKRDGHDGVYVTSLAYRRQCEKAPKGIVFPDNFILDLAIGTHSHSIREWGSEPRREAASYGKPGEMYDFFENAKEWGKITSHMSYWLYCDPFLATSQRLQKEIRELREIGVESVGACGGDGMGGGWAFSGINAYFFLRLLYNPDMDIDAEADKAFAALYGPGAAAVKSFWLDLEKIRVRSLPLGRRLSGFTYFTGADIIRIGKTMDGGYELVKGTKYQDAYEYVLMYADMLRVAYPERVAEADPNYSVDINAARSRAETAANRYFDKYVVGGYRQWAKPILDIMDETAYVPLLKTKELPPELQGYNPKKVTRLLPIKRKKNPWWKKPEWTSEEDPLAACGWTTAGDVPKEVDFKSRPPEFQIYEWATGKYHREHIFLPKGFIASDRYKLFNLGKSHLGMTSNLFFGRWAKQAMEISTIRRCADPIFLDKEFEIWVSVRGEGPKLFPGDTRKDRLFIDQVFVVDCN